MTQFATKPKHTRPIHLAPTVEQIKKLFNYDKETGIFTFASDRGSKKKGDIAGAINPAGYRLLRIDYILWMAHQCAWLYHYGEWPTQMIDHINRERADNRIENLRLVDYSESGYNRAVSRSKTKGVYYNKKNSNFMVQFTIDGKLRYFGSFSTYELALQQANSIRTTLSLD